MPYRYVAYNSQGQRLVGTLTVDTEPEAEDLLWRSDLTIASLHREGGGLQELKRWFARQVPTLSRPKATELVSFTRQLATLLESGIAIVPALNNLLERVGSPLLKDAIQRIIRDLEGGGSLSQAIGKYPVVFPPIYSRLVSVGEETGRLEPVLLQVATYIDKQAALARKVRGALGYPAFVGVVGIFAGFILVTFSLPAMVGLFREYGAELPLATRLLIGFSNLVGEFGSRMLLTLGLIAALLFVYFRTRPGARHWNSLLLRIPLIGRVIRLTNMFRFTNTANALLAAGLPMTEVLEMTARAIGNIKVREAVLSVRQEIMVGLSLSQALTRYPLFPSMIPQMVAVGEQSGTIAQNLATLSDFFDQETDRQVSRLAGMIEPAMILMIGGVVAFVAVAIMSSLYGIIGKIQ